MEEATRLSISSHVNNPLTWFDNLLTHHYHNEGSWLYGPLWSAAGSCCRSFAVFGGTEKYLFRFWIKSHCTSAWLSLHGSGVFIYVRRLFTIDAQNSLAT